ncbi:hypothetical protein HDU80_002645, partial [Chytriomyces hyalinus]
VLKVPEQKPAWDIVKYGLYNYKLLSDLFEANLAMGDLAKGSNENSTPDPDPQDSNHSDEEIPSPEPPPPVWNPFTEAGAGRSTNLMSTPALVPDDS